MAEVLLSPGVSAIENDNSFISAQPVQAGAAILGPTVKGPVGIPTVVTSYSEYKNKFGCIVESGSVEYTYFTSIAAYNHFQQGGGSLLVTRVVSGSYSAASSSISGANDTASFVLETLSEGEIMNSSGSEDSSSGALSSGSKENVRWEIQSPNTAAGTFNLLIRRGDDITTSKNILETWANLSLDPNSPNYIEKAIGNSKQTVKEDDGDHYVENTGTYNTLSKYVRVKSVGQPTLNYLDNSGDAKEALTGSIPQAGSGSFAGASGSIASGANFYENIDSTSSQGLTGNDYTESISLLSNQDQYRYNLIIAPGLTKENNSSTVSQMIDSSQQRGDSLAIVDLRDWGSTISQATNGAAGIDSSYAATYWPWVQTIDPDLGSQVWVPASTMMAGVYAFNDKAGEAWFAPAGLNRGGMSTVLRAERALTNGNRDTLYQANINPIATFPNTGVVVFGQKTMQKKPSSLDRVNVRRLLIALKNFISQIGDQLVFEQNSTATRNNFLAQVNPYLASVQQRQGLYAFKVVMDESNNTPDVIDRNQLIGQIYIQPTRTAEFIYLNFNVQPTGASFE
tara:strand:+ start:2077 stop:3777 length:1701 start_codon:yes stop_codon:yes gene_type:complete